MSDVTTTAVADAPAATTTAPAPAATPAPAAPAASGYDWKALNLAPELQNVVDRHQFSDPAMVVKSYGEFEKLHGVPVDQIIKLPGKKDAADPKAWDAVYNKLGRPETPDKYVIPVPEGSDGAFAAQIKPWLHEAGVTQAGAAKLAEKWNGFQAAQAQAMQAEQAQRETAQIQELKLSWGTQFDARAQTVDKAADAFGMKPEQVTALRNAMGPKAAMEFLYNIGAKMGVEDGSVPGMGSGSTSSSQMTPDMAKAEIARLRGDREFSKIFTSNDPKQKMDARREMDRLHQLAYPGSSKADMIAR